MHTQTPPSEEIIVEAEDLEAALAEVAARLGARAEIIDARKVQRGGIGGFFAKELVAVRARPGERAAGVDGAIEALVGAADDRETEFEKVLRDQMAEDAHPSDPAPLPVGPMASETAAAAGSIQLVGEVAPAGTIPEPPFEPTGTGGDLAPIAERREPAGDGNAWRTVEVAGPRGCGRVGWSSTALAKIGLPTDIVEATRNLDPRDDLAWIEAIAQAVHPLCGPLPDVPVVVAGGQADRLAGLLDLPLVNPPGMPPYSGSVCAVVTDDQRDLDWLRFIRGERALHLVIGDEPWRDLLVGDLAAVSWFGDRSIIDAVYLASSLGCVLGFGTVDGFASAAVRPRPVDVALAIRRLVERV